MTLHVREDRRLLIGGVDGIPAPTPDEVAESLVAIASQPDLERTVKELAAIHMELRRLNEVRDFTLWTSARLVSVAYHVEAVMAAVAMAGEPGPFQLALLVGGLTAGQGMQPAVIAAIYIEAAKWVRAEMERRADAHEVGAIAATVAMALRGRAEDGPHVAAAVSELRTMLRLPTHVKRETSGRSAVPLLDPDAAMADALDKETAGQTVLEIMARALDGELCGAPLSIKRDLQDEAERHRRWEGRGADPADPKAAKHARGRRMLETVAAAEFDGEGGERSDPGEDHPRRRKASDLPQKASELRSDLTPEALLDHARIVVEAELAEKLPGSPRARQRRLKDLRDELRLAAGKPKRTRHATKKPKK